MEDADLEQQAQAMAEKALAALPESARAAKIGKVKEGILKRLQAQAANSVATAIGVSQPTLVGVTLPGGASPPPAPSPAVAPGAALPGRPPPPPVPPPPPEGEAPGRLSAEKLPGIEAIGDETWYSDLGFRRYLREKVVAAHAAQKILVGQPADEIRRICPGAGRVLGAGAVLRLGGATLGGYGEGDIAYAYRQLSRALHPDKNPDVPEAHDAFKRLTEAADELRAGLTEQRTMLRMIVATMGLSTTEEMLERPQEALFADATRMLYAVLALSGEGEVPVLALNRGLAAYASSPVWGTGPAQVLLGEWYDQQRLLDLFAHPQLRIVYDCARKRLRAQFLCTLNRAALAEAKRHNDCVRGNWQAVMMQFPEVGMWRELYDKLRGRVWSREAIKRERGSMWDDEEGPRASAWAKVWRGRIAAILPRGVDAAVPWTDPEVRQLCAALWKDVAEWARSLEGDQERPLQLFTAEPPVPGAPDAPATPDEWAYVPAADLLLLVGEGIVGMTAEGIFADNRPGHERMSLEDAMAGKWERKKKEKDKKSKDEDDEGGKKSGLKEKDGKGSKEASVPKNAPNFDWEQVWRQRVQTIKEKARRVRGPSPAARSASRERRRASRSRERRRERSRRPLAPSEPRESDRRRSRSRRKD